MNAGRGQPRGEKTHNSDLPGQHIEKTDPGPRPISKRREPVTRTAMTGMNPQKVRQSQPVTRSLPWMERVLECEL
jgi:hypothetical protein